MNKKLYVFTSPEMVSIAMLQEKASSMFQLASEGINDNVNVSRQRTASRVKEKSKWCQKEKQSTMPSSQKTFLMNLAAL